MKQLSCSQCRDRWDELITKSTFPVDSPEFADVIAHLESCRECHQAFEQQKAIQREMQQMPSLKAPANLRSNIRAQITQESARVSWLAPLTAFFHSPQKMAWAGSALVAVFLVAFIMRPGQQTAVLDNQPGPLSNRDQITLHNQEHQPPAQPPQSVTPEPAHTPPTTKPQPQATPPTKRKSTKIPPRPRASQKTTVSRPHHPVPQEKTASKPLPKPSPTKPALTPPAPEPATESAEVQPQPAPAPKAERFMPPAPAVTQKESADENATGDRASENRKQSNAPQGPSGPPATLQRTDPHRKAAPAFRAQNDATLPVTTWEKTITPEMDVAFAQVYAELESGLTFANNKETKRLVWEGTLHAGQAITLHLKLRHTSDQPGALRLTIVNADNQKVLWAARAEVAQE